MQYFISFLEGVVTFISPCLLPLLPVYISYFAGEEGGRRRTLANAAGFVLGFTIPFALMGIFAATVGVLLMRYQTALNLVTGGIVVLFGLSYLGVIRVNLFKGTRGGFLRRGKAGFAKAVLFGAVFSVGWTPCVGAFLGSALMLASQQGSALRGGAMLVCYSLGLGIPFLVSAVLIDQMKSTIRWIKGHYRVITAISGSLLIVMGILMMTGTFGYWLAFLSR